MKSCITRRSRSWKVLARAEAPDGSQRDRHALKIRVLNVTKKELLRDIEEGAGIRPERAVQKSVRRRIRSFRRRSVWRADRRLRIREASGRSGAAGRNFACGGTGARAVCERGGSRSIESGELHAHSMPRAIWRRFSTARNMPSGNRSARARIRAMSLCACRARFARLPTAKRPSRSMNSLTKSTSTGRTTPSICG